MNDELNRLAIELELNLVQEERLEGKMKALAEKRAAIVNRISSLGGHDLIEKVEDDFARERRITERLLELVDLTA
ncbi:MAG: hypothetical protein K0R61_753 [Microvirga sp.]|jgi:hypothetical protein|nr:hypothetical protein [Microvirga sp.]